MTPAEVKLMEHCTLCHLINEEFDDDGFPDGCCCCQIHKVHGGEWPPRIN
ncbi:hypothetical protein LCGC14_1417560 [marine sediment metagenome]|uniref:Uncharacterized protein n=1 Tax=marine sediment metagenome TaxID=412755 RepID=A0A0F9M7U8_9ZZZZ